MAAAFDGAGFSGDVAAIMSCQFQRDGTTVCQRAAHQLLYSSEKQTLVDAVTKTFNAGGTKPIAGDAIYVNSNRGSGGS